MIVLPFHMWLFILTRFYVSASLLFASCCFCFFDLLGKNRNDLVQVAYYAVIGNVEDRSRLIFVDGNDDVGLFHTSHVLDGSGDTDGKVNMGTNSLTSLSNLKILRLPASVYNCTGAAYGAADGLSQLVEDLEVLRASYCLLYTSPSPRD